MDFIKSALKQIDDQECENLYDMIYLLFFYAKMEDSMDDVRNGRTYSLEEFDAYMKDLENSIKTGNFENPTERRTAV